VISTGGVERSTRLPFPPLVIDRGCLKGSIGPSCVLGRVCLIKKDDARHRVFFPFSQELYGTPTSMVVLVPRNGGPWGMGNQPEQQIRRNCSLRVRPFFFQFEQDRSQKEVVRDVSSHRSLSHELEKARAMCVGKAQPSVQFRVGGGHRCWLDAPLLSESLVKYTLAPPNPAEAASALAVVGFGADAATTFWATRHRTALFNFSTFTLFNSDHICIPPPQ
jgi:hypothetical protein